MHPALLVRFRPSGPWRIGPASGAADEVDRVFHSDTLFSAVTGALARLGLLEAWLDDTVRSEAGPAVRFSSCGPWMGDLLLVTPPRSLWPPAATPRVRWKSAQFVPLRLIPALLAGEPLREENWWIDPPSRCLLPQRGRQRHGPFRPAFRSHAAVDRLTGSALPHRTACLEFAPDAGLWTIAVFAGDEARRRWGGPLKSALLLLADSGLGGRRSLGWGHSEAPEFTEGHFPEMILPANGAPPESAEAEPRQTAWWLLSLFTPAPADAVDWTKGSYELTTRGGRVESPARSGEPKKLVRMLAEGSVLVAPQAPSGAATDVAPDGFPHPVYRAGFAVAVPIPVRPAEVRA